MLTLTLIGLALSACARSGSSMNGSAPTMAAPADTVFNADDVKKTLQDYIHQQHGESSGEGSTDVMIWVTNQDLLKIPLAPRTLYRAEQNNLELDRVRQNLRLQSRTDIDADSYLLMRGLTTSVNDTAQEKKFQQGVSTVCQVSKSTEKTIQPTNFSLVQSNFSHTDEFNMIDMQWKDSAGDSVFTRCLSRQVFTLGDLRAALQNQFIVTVN
jgi:hypothetical protein